MSIRKIIEEVLEIEGRSEEDIKNDIKNTIQLLELALKEKPNIKVVNLRDARDKLSSILDYYKEVSKAFKNNNRIEFK